MFGGPTSTKNLDNKSIDRFSKISDSQSIFEIQSRHPGADDFDAMSMVSRSSMRSIAQHMRGEEYTPSRKRPLIFVDVNLGKDKGKQKLVVYEGESPLLAAKKFAEQHGKYNLFIIQIPKLIE